MQLEVNAAGESIRKAIALRWRVAGSAKARRFLEQRALTLGKMLRDVHVETDVEVALLVWVFHIGHAAAAQAEDLIRLCAGRDAQLHAPRRGLYRYLPTQKQGEDVDLHIRIQVFAVALKARIREYLDDKVEVSAIWGGAAHTHFGTVIHSSWDAHAQ